jgi:cytochrome c553
LPTDQSSNYRFLSILLMAQHARPSTGVGGTNGTAANLTDDDIKAISAYLEACK